MQRRPTVLYLRCSSGRNDLSAPISLHDSYEAVARSLAGIDWRSLRCVFEGPGALYQQAQGIQIGEEHLPRQLAEHFSRAILLAYDT